MSEHNTKQNIKEIKYELTKLRHTSDLATRQGQSKIDRNAELEALRLREQRWQQLSAAKIDPATIDIKQENKMLEIQDINTYIHQYRERLNTIKNKDET